MPSRSPRWPPKESSDGSADRLGRGSGGQASPKRLPIAECSAAKAAAKPRKLREAPFQTESAKTSSSNRSVINRSWETKAVDSWKPHIQLHKWGDKKYQENLDRRRHQEGWQTKAAAGAMAHGSRTGQE